MAAKTLNLLPFAEENTHLFGLSSNEKAVKLVWAINKETKLDFQRVDDFVVSRQRKDCHFIRYVYDDDVFEIHYELYKNQCDGALLIPELKMVTYFIQVFYNDMEPEKEIFLKLNKPEAGQLCFELGLDQLKPVTRNMLGI